MSADLADIRAMGRHVAERIAGAQAVGDVDVRAGFAFDRPVYHFTFLIEQRLAHHRAGIVRTRLIQALSDELIARRDDHHPMIEVLDRQDWDHRHVA